MTAQVIPFVKPPQQQIAVRCSFCGKPNTSVMLTSGDKRKFMCMPCVAHAKQRMEETHA